MFLRMLIKLLGAATTTFINVAATLFKTLLHLCLYGLGFIILIPFIALKMVYRTLNELFNNGPIEALQVLAITPFYLAIPVVWTIVSLIQMTSHLIESPLMGFALGLRDFDDYFDRLGWSFRDALEAIGEVQNDIPRWNRLGNEASGIILLEILLGFTSSAFQNQIFAFIPTNLTRRVSQHLSYLENRYNNPPPIVRPLQQNTPGYVPNQRPAAPVANPGIAPPIASCQPVAQTMQPLEASPPRPIDAIAFSDEELAAIINKQQGPLTDTEIERLKAEHPQHATKYDDLLKKLEDECPLAFAIPEKMNAVVLVKQTKSPTDGQWKNSPMTSSVFDKAALSDWYDKNKSKGHVPTHPLMPSDSLDGSDEPECYRYRFHSLYVEMTRDDKISEELYDHLILVRNILSHAIQPQVPIPSISEHQAFVLFRPISPDDTVDGRESQIPEPF